MTCRKLSPLLVRTYVNLLVSTTYDFPGDFAKIAMFENCAVLKAYG